MPIQKHKRKSTNIIQEFLHKILLALKIILKIIIVLKTIFELIFTK